MDRLEIHFYLTMLFLGLVAIFTNSTPLSVLVGSLLICWEISEYQEYKNKSEKEVDDEQ